MKNFVLPLLLSLHKYINFQPEDDSQGGGRTITLKLIKQWQSDIHKDKSAKTIHHLAKAFNAALIRVSSDDSAPSSEYRVDGSSVFNAVIQLCVMEMGPALRRYLKLPSGSKQAPHKCKKFLKIRTVLRGYFLDLLKVGFMTGHTIIAVKHKFSINIT